MKAIDLENWPRAQHFHLYQTIASPYVGICAEVEITELLAYCRQHQLSSYRAIIYAFVLCTEQLPWLRQRIRGQQVVEHAQVQIGITGLHADQQVRFGRIEPALNWPQFDAQAQRTIANLYHTSELFEGAAAAIDDNVIYLSCLPWLRFSQCSHPVPMAPSCSIPRIAWGKYHQEGAQTRMPVSIQAHHGLADGWHVAQCYHLLEQLFSQPQQWLSVAPAQTA